MVKSLLLGQVIHNPTWELFWNQYDTCYCFPFVLFPMRTFKLYNFLYIIIFFSLQSCHSPPLKSTSSCHSFLLIEMNGKVDGLNYSIRMIFFLLSTLLSAWCDGFCSLKWWLEGWKMVIMTDLCSNVFLGIDRVIYSIWKMYSFGMFQLCGALRNFFISLCGRCYTWLQVDELQNTIEEEQRSLMEEMRTAIDEPRTGLEDATGGPEAMALD